MKMQRRNLLYKYSASNSTLQQQILTGGATLPSPNVRASRLERWLGNDSTVPTVPNRQTIRKDGDRRETGPAENTPAHKSSYNVIANISYYNILVQHQPYTVVSHQENNFELDPTDGQLVENGGQDTAELGYVQD